MELIVKDLTFSYNGKPVLREVNTNLSKGDFLALVGPNGSGKSTLLKCMNGILKSNTGGILLDQKELGKISLSDLAKDMAYVPQSENRLSQLSVFDTVLMGRKPYISWRPSQKDLTVAAGILKELDIDDIAMRPVTKLSGGQQQRVYIARALAQEPKLMLLDEPTSNLDLKHQIEVMELLKKLAEQGMGIIIALHDINLALKYAQKIMMLKQGSVFKQCTSDAVTASMIEALYDIKVEMIQGDHGNFMIPKGTNKIH